MMGLLDLPEKALMNVLERLPALDVPAFCSINRAARALSAAPGFWAHQYKMRHLACAAAAAPAASSFLWPAKPGATYDDFLYESLFEAGKTEKILTNPDITRPVFVKTVFSPDGRMVATGSDNGYVTLFDLQNAQIDELEVTGRHEIVALAFSPDGSRLATVTVGGRGPCVVWDTETCMRTFELDDDFSVSAAFSSDGRTLLTADGTTVRLWNMQDGTLIRRLNNLSGDFKSKLSPEGTILAASTRGLVHLWDLRTGARAWELRPNRLDALLVGRPNTLSFNLDGRALALASADKISNIVTTWDTQTGARTNFLRLPPFFPWRRNFFQPRECTCLAMSPSGRTVAIGMSFSAVRLWDTHTGHITWIGALLRDRPIGLEFSPDGRTLAISFTDATFCQVVAVPTGT